MSTITRSGAPSRGSGQQAVKPNGGLRPDIQGLRAVAVLAVILDHLFHWPSGGFVGVDVFFVISGFLITGLLIREHDRSGRISFADFYRRRVKRIMPAAMVVVVATSAAAYFLFSAARAKDVFTDAIWATLFSANWRFVTAGTDYFDAAGAVSPLQHFWSLAVEEQFYFVWPWLMLLIFFVASGRKGGSTKAAHIAIGVTMTLIVVASFLWALVETMTQPTWAYFSTFSRAWELGVGALLAVGATRLSRIPNVIRPVLAWLGLLGIVLSLFLVTADSMFPAPWAALPVMSSALVIAAGTGGQQKYLWPLTNRVMGYIGDISYSLYLWHFPLIVFLALVVPEGLMFYGAVLIAAFACAAASYHWVENPVRNSVWLEPRDSPKRQAKRREAGKSQNLQLAGLASLTVATLVVSALALTRTAPQEQASVAVTAPKAAPLAGTGADAAATTAAATHSSAITTALQAQAWPELSPAIDVLGREQLVPEWSVDGCLGNEMNSVGDPARNAERCVYGDPAAQKTAVVLGDSVSISYVSGIRAALEPQGYKVLVYTLMQCPAFSVSVLKNDRSEHPMCDPFREWTLGKVAEVRPNMVLMSNSTAARLSSGAEDTAMLTEWTSGAQKSLTALAGSTERVIVLDPPPGGKNLADCATRISKPADCTTSVNGHYRSLAEAGRAGAQGLPNVRFIDTRLWFCSANNICPAFVGGTTVYADGGHLTGTYSKSLGPIIAEALAG